MRLIKTVLDFYVRSSLHVAACFVALFCCLNFYHLEKFQWHLFLILFSGALIGYNLIKYADLIYLGKTFLFKNAIISISIFFICITAAVLYLENMLSITVLAISSGIGLLYMLPFYKGKGLRSIPILKIASVAISWVVLLIFYPRFSEFYSGISWSKNSIIYISLETLEVLALVSALCVPFEIRDLKYDDPGLKTLPQLIGVATTKKLGVLMTLLFLLFHLLKTDLISTADIFITSLTSIVLIILILKAAVRRPDYYASIMVEAVPLLWLGLLWAHAEF